MRERPILFSAPMVRAILAGQKTQTRRVVKGALDHPDAEAHMIRGEAHFGIRGPGTFHFTHGEEGDLPAIRCPYGKPGDRLWVREASRAEELPVTAQDGVRYLADDAFRPIENTPEAAMKWLDMFCYGQSTPGDGVRIGRGVPSIHMPRWASRILLEIISVRVERLTDCTEADALAEGSQHPSLVPIVGAGWSSRDMYARLWEHINGEGSWAANPWVWVVSFQRVDAQALRGVA